MKLKPIGLAVLFSLTVAGVTTQTFSTGAWAEEDEITKEETASKDIASKPDWQEAVQKRYELKPEQLQAMRDAGITNPQMAIVAELSKQSGKPIDEILKMRQEQKMGWGQIAKTLNLPPGTIGHAVADLRKDIHAKRFEKKDERKDKRKDKREERREERKQKRENRKAERAERKDKHAGQ